MSVSVLANTEGGEWGALLVKAVLLYPHHVTEVRLHPFVVFQDLIGHRRTLLLRRSLWLWKLLGTFLLPPLRLASLFYDHGWSVRLGTRRSASALPEVGLPPVWEKDVSHFQVGTSQSQRWANNELHSGWRIEDG